MRIIKWLDRYLEEFLASSLLAVIVVIMSIQIFMRYVMNNSLPWPEELSRYLFVWSTFIGVSYCIKHSYHMRINILETFIPVLEKPLLILSNVVFLIFCLIMFNPSARAVLSMLRSGQASPALEIPTAYVYVSLLIGFGLSIIRLVQKLYMIFFGKK